jgi:hypothetical protein
MQQKNDINKKILLKRSPSDPVEQLLTSEFETENGIAWTESIIFETESLAAQFRPFNIITNCLKNTIYRHLKRNANSLIITYKDRQVGYTVVTNQTIGDREFVATYAGLVRNPFEEGYFGEYSFLIQDSDPQTSVAIDGEYYRNIGSYIQHAPSSLTHYNLSGIHPSDVATANLQAYFFTCDSNPLLVFRATRTINKGEELYFDYGDQYWRYPNKKTAVLFRINGEIIPSLCYSVNVIPTLLQLPDETKDQTLQLSKTAKLPRIPTLSIKERKKIDMSETLDLSSRIKYTLFDRSGQRLQRHLDAKQLTLALYEIGATIANEEADYYENHQSVNSETKDRLLILEEYHRIKKYITLGSDRCAIVNPLQALLLIKVALHHLPPKLISKLSKHSHHQMTFGQSISFPNGSEFTSDLAVYDIIGIYKRTNASEFMFDRSFCIMLNEYNIVPEKSPVMSVCGVGEINEPIRADAQTIFDTKYLSRVDSHHTLVDTSPELLCLLDIEKNEDQKAALDAEENQQFDKTIVLVNLGEKVDEVHDSSNSGELSTTRSLPTYPQISLFFGKSSGSLSESDSDKLVSQTKNPQSFYTSES